MDDPPKKKRKRSANWTSEEKNIAVNLIQPVIHIIDNKIVNPEVNNAKTKEYQKICEKFYQQTGIKRDVKDIKSFWCRWKNSKKFVRKRKVNEKRKQKKIVMKDKPIPKTRLPWYMRKRMTFWSWEEKSIFLKIIGPSLPILENIDNNTETTLAKAQEWKTLTEKLYKLTRIEREPRELSYCWNRLKIICKEKNGLGDSQVDITSLYGKIVAAHLALKSNFVKDDDEISIDNEETEPFLGFPINESTHETEPQQANNDRVLKKFSLADLIEDTYDKTKMKEQRNCSKEKIINKRPNMDEDKDSSNGKYKTKRPNTARTRDFVNNNESQSITPNIDNETSQDKIPNMDGEIDVINEKTQTKRPNMEDERDGDENSLVNMGHNWTMNRPDIDRLTEYIAENLQAVRPKMEELSEEEIRKSSDDEKLQSLEDFTCEDGNDSHQGDIPELSDHSYCQTPGSVKKENEDPPDGTFEKENVSCVPTDPLQIDALIKVEMVEENETSNEQNNESSNEVDDETSKDVTNETSIEERNETLGDINAKASNEGKQTLGTKAETIKISMDVNSLTMKKLTQEGTKEGITKAIIRDLKKKKSKSIDIKNKESRNADKQKLEVLRRLKKQIEETHTLEMEYQRKKLEYMQFKHKMEMELMDFEKRRKEMFLERLNKTL